MHGEPSRAIDWTEVQAYYDEGYTILECRVQFGFSKRAWEEARLRGEVRSRPPGGRTGKTHREIKGLLKQGLSNIEIARTLGIAKSTVSFHARKVGIPADARFSHRVDWAEVQTAHDAGMSVRECARTFGFHKGSWSKAVRRGAIKPRDHRIPVEKLLVKGRKTGRGHLKIRLQTAGLLKYECDDCGLTDWRGKRLALELHHINGDGLDNRLENLQLLCPNCHSQTDTWGGRNSGRRNGVQAGHDPRPKPARSTAPPRKQASGSRSSMT